MVVRYLGLCSPRDRESALSLAASSKQESPLIEIQEGSIYKGFGKGLYETNKNIVDICKQ